uniref:Ig-like domain-containing protein n=1 Tax=Lates calcarifer TaxID=8187 RepID=A0A4W6F9B7_LATCA
NMTIYIQLSLIQTAEVPQQISVNVVEVGGNVTLQCQISEKEGQFFNWYRQTPGYMIQTVAKGTYSKQTLTGQFDNSRFKVTEGEAEYLLTINNVTKEDEATYFCQSGAAYSQSFVNGTYLAVNGKLCYFPLVFFPFQVTSLSQVEHSCVTCELLLILLLLQEDSKMPLIPAPQLDPVDFVLGGLLACSLAVITVLVFCLNQRRACKNCKGRFIERT